MIEKGNRQVKKLRIAVIGCGRIFSVYEDAFCKLGEEMELVLAMDKELARAEAAAAKHPGCIASDQVGILEFKEILTRIKPDLIHILLPHHLHGRYAAAAMKCEINVLTEKPITISLTEADELIGVQKKTGMQLGVIFQNRYINGVQRVRELIKTGALGNVKGAFSTLNWFRPPSYYDCDWKGRWETEGGGVIIDQAIHSIDLVRYMTGCEAVKVMGHTARRVLTQIEVEDEADAAVWLDNGAVYSFYACNYFTCNSPIRVGISCENGTAVLTHDRMEIMWKDGKREEILPDTDDNGNGESYWGSCHYTQIRQCYKALREGCPIPWTPEDAKKTLAIVQGIYESSRIQGIVELQ